MTAPAKRGGRVSVPVETLYNVISLFGQHYQRSPTWHGDRMCVCGNGPFPCNYAQARDVLTKIIETGVDSTPGKG